MSILTTHYSVVLIAYASSDYNHMSYHAFLYLFYCLTSVALDMIN